MIFIILGALGFLAFTGIFIVLWKVFVAPLFEFKAHLSHEIRESVFPGILEMDKTIITICSAAIVLTVNLIQHDLVGKKYLAVAWIGFAIGITLGVIILGVHFSHRLVDNVMVRMGYKATKNQVIDKISPEWKVVMIALERQALLSRTLFILIWCQVTSLVAAMVALIVFGLINLS